MQAVSTGTVLISDPFLKDLNFSRSAILLCEHQQEGSFGFILNKKNEQLIGELLSDLEGCNFPVYFGGPVQVDTIHYLHECPDLVPGGVEVVEGIFWGGDFEKLYTNIHDKKIKENEVRFYLGYSGWSEGQLAREIQEESWLTTEGRKELVFHPNSEKIWQDAIKQMGEAYYPLLLYPIDPRLN